mgnify:CR=1 FL=1
MTLPDERYRALAQLPEALMALCEMKRVSKTELRRAVAYILRHYPLSYEIDALTKASPKLLRKR